MARLYHSAIDADVVHLGDDLFRRGIEVTGGWRQVVPCVVHPVRSPQESAEIASPDVQFVRVLALVPIAPDDPRVVVKSAALRPVKNDVVANCMCRSTDSNPDDPPIFGKMWTWESTVPDLFILFLWLAGHCFGDQTESLHRSRSKTLGLRLYTICYVSGCRTVGVMPMQRRT